MTDDPRRRALMRQGFLFLFLALVVGLAIIALFLRETPTLGLALLAVPAATVASLVAYAQLTRSLLPVPERMSLGTAARITMSTLGISHGSEPFARYASLSR